jgi:hypothetical protein
MAGKVVLCTLVGHTHTSLYSGDRLPACVLLMLRSLEATPLGLE